MSSDKWMDKMWAWSASRVSLYKFICRLSRSAHTMALQNPLCVCVCASFYCVLRWKVNGSNYFLGNARYCELCEKPIYITKARILLHTVCCVAFRIQNNPISFESCEKPTFLCAEPLADNARSATISSSFSSCFTFSMMCFLLICRFYCLASRS